MTEEERAASQYTHIQEYADKDRHIQNYRRNISVKSNKNCSYLDFVTMFGKTDRSTVFQNLSPAFAFSCNKTP
jgi:hypothetical protein